MSTSNTKTAVMMGEGARRNTRMKRIREDKNRVLPDLHPDEPIEKQEDRRRDERATRFPNSRRG